MTRILPLLKLIIEYIEIKIQILTKLGENIPTICFYFYLITLKMMNFHI